MFSLGLLLALMVYSPSGTHLWLPSRSGEMRPERHTRASSSTEGSTKPSKALHTHQRSVPKLHVYTATHTLLRHTPEVTLCAQKHHLPATVSRSHCLPKSEAQRPLRTLSK